MSLIHAQQVANLNSNFQDSRSSADLTLVRADRKHRANKQLQKSKNNKNQYSNCEKINYLESSY